MSLYFNTDLFGKRMKHYRLIKEYSQAKLAEEVGVSTNFLGDMERGIKAPSLTVLIRIAGALDVTPDELLIDSLKTNIMEDKDIMLSDIEMSYVKQLVKIVREKQIICESERKRQKML